MGKDMTGRNLLAITTAGRLHFLRDAIKTLRDPVDVLVVDDATPESVGIEAFCKKHKLHFMTKTKPRGLTNSWNLAYQFFKNRNYNTCIISNDDVRFPKGFSSGLINGTKRFSAVCPLSNRPTRNPRMFPLQWLNRYARVKAGKDRVSRDAVQQLLQKKFAKHPYRKVTAFNGFCFAFGKSIHKYRVSEDILFNGHLNTKNEICLYRRILKRGGSVAICLRSYVFHWKRGTYSELRLKHADQLWTQSKNPVGK